MKKIFRKKTHKTYLNSIITELHIDIVNMSVRSHKKLTKDVQTSIVNKATLIRKYERRLSLVSM